MNQNNHVLPIFLYISLIFLAVLWSRSNLDRIRLWITNPDSLFELGKRSPGPKFKPTSSAKIARAAFTPCPAEKPSRANVANTPCSAPLCANRSSLTPKCLFRAIVAASSKFAASWSCLCVKSFRAQASAQYGSHALPVHNYLPLFALLALTGSLTVA